MLFHIFSPYILNAKCYFVVAKSTEKYSLKWKNIMFCFVGAGQMLFLITMCLGYLTCCYLPVNYGHFMLFTNVMIHKGHLDLRNQRI